jgi:hypothetical protein
MPSLPLSLPPPPFRHASGAISAAAFLALRQADATPLMPPLPIFSHSRDYARFDTPFDATVYATAFARQLPGRHAAAITTSRPLYRPAISPLR